MKDAVAVLHITSFYICRKPRLGDELETRHIPQSDWPSFHAAITKEWTSIVDMKAVTVLNKKDSAAIL